LHQLGGQRVSLDISKYRQEVMVLLNRKGLEAARPETPRCCVSFAMPADVAAEQPMHPPREIVVMIWTQHEVHVVRHEARRKERHRNASLRC
jgi:hypothetical protein